MARIPLDPPRSIQNRLLAWYSRRSFGAVLEPSLALAHHPQVLRGDTRWEMSVQRWHRLPAGLSALAQLAAASTVGCSWCMDFGYWLSMSGGLDAAKVREASHWRDSVAYTDVERRVLAYAEAMSVTPPTVTDEMVAGLRADLDDAQLVELTMMIAVENQRSRVNSALGLTSQGFADRCELAPHDA